MSEQLKCLCASIVSAICSRAALAQTCHTIAALLFYFCNSWAKEPWSVGKNRENQRKILVSVTFAVKLGSESQECWFCLLEMSDEVLLSLWSSFLFGISAGSRQNSQGDPDTDGRMLSHQRKGGGWKQHRAIPSCARSSVPNNLGSAFAQQSSQQPRNTNDGRNYTIKMQGKTMEKKYPEDLRSEFLRKAAPWCRLGETGFRSHLCLPLKTDFLQQ